MKKKIMMVIAVALIAIAAVFGAAMILLSAIGNSRYTSGYTKMKNVYDRIDNGRFVSKEEVFDELGYPDSFRNSSGERTAVDYMNREAYKDAIFETDVVEWYYSDYKYRDPSDPWYLQIYFDESGESTKAIFDYMPGG